MPYPCCCEPQPAPCDTAILIEISGVTNGSCSTCGSQWNDSFAVASGGECLITGNHCNTSGTLTECYCRWDWNSGSTECIDDSDDNVFFFIQAAGQKYAIMQIWNGSTYIAYWRKAVSEYSFPVTFTSTNYISSSGTCTSSTSVCNFSNATVVVSEP